MAVDIMWRFTETCLLILCMAVDTACGDLLRLGIFG